VSVNFRYFAVNYLNDWWWYDRYYVDGLRDQDETIRVKRLHEAAVYYKVVRNFKYGGDGDDVRLGPALKLLEGIEKPTEKTVDDAIETLALKFKEKYGKDAISASSKFLWLKHQWPVVIFDNRAVLCLRSRGCRFTDYGEYRQRWREQFAQHAKAIQDASGELPMVKAFSAAHSMSEKELVDIVGGAWFHERVFDKYLWSTAGQVFEG
jgi:hypothetical protein